MTKHLGGILPKKKVLSLWITERQGKKKVEIKARRAIKSIKDVEGVVLIGSKA